MSPGQCGTSFSKGEIAKTRQRTLAISRPDNLMITLQAYGWDRAPGKSIATHTARGAQYGRFPEPRKQGRIGLRAVETLDVKTPRGV